MFRQCYDNYLIRTRNPSCSKCRSEVRTSVMEDFRIAFMAMQSVKL